MKATDLMIGDFVFYKNFKGNLVPHKITCISETFAEFEDPPYDLYKYERMYPIPLTPEILEKNGLLVGYKKAEIIYYHIGEDFYLDLNGEEILLKLRRECGYDFTFFGIISCKYVHNLQHALKLCGIEKEIKL